MRLARFDASLRAAGYIAMSGQIADATLVAAPRQRNRAEEKAEIKAGHVPADWTAPIVGRQLASAYKPGATEGQMRIMKGLARWSATGLLMMSGISASGQEPKQVGPPLAILLAAGDIARCDNKGVDEATAKVLTREINAAQKAGVRVHVLALGDLAYSSGSTADFKCFGESWGKPDIYPHLLPVPGNHDVREHPGARPYFDFFAELPIVAESRARGGYYAIEVAYKVEPAWRIYGLNTYAGIGSSSEQLAWLNDDLKAHRTPCVLAFWHPFLFSSGHHGHKHSRDPNAPTKRLDNGAAPFRVLHRHGATVVLTAHDHDFEQFGRHDVDGRAAADGIRSFVVGTGGAPLYNRVVYKTRAPNSEAYDQDTHGVLRLELYPGRYSWSFLPIAGGKATALKPSEEHCNARRPG